MIGSGSDFQKYISFHIHIHLPFWSLNVRKGWTKLPRKREFSKGISFWGIGPNFKVWDRIIFKGRMNTHIYSQSTLDFFLSHFVVYSFTGPRRYMCKSHVSASHIHITHKHIYMHMQIYIIYMHIYYVCELLAYRDVERTK